MSDREKAYQLLDTVPDYKIGYVVAYLQGITDGEEVKPNKETLEAFAEVDEMKRVGSGQKFDNFDDLWASLICCSYFGNPGSITTKKSGS